MEPGAARALQPKPPRPAKTAWQAALTPVHWLQQAIQANLPGGQGRWVPIRSLLPRHRGRIIQHLLQLDEQDRYLRFGHPASDDQIRRYAKSLDFERDEVFGIFNRRLQLVAMAHLAYEPPQQWANRPAMVEFGVSVLKQARGKGLGARLFKQAVMHARNRQVDTLYIHALSENTPMLSIARKAGALVERDGSESAAYLKLPHDSLRSHMEELIARQVAEADYQLKKNVTAVKRVVKALQEVRKGIQQVRHRRID